MFIKLIRYDNKQILVNTATVVDIVQVGESGGGGCDIAFNFSDSDGDYIYRNVKESLEEIEQKIVNCNRVGSAVTQ
tara:strand:- start:87 stop:314 length:228 start_codon:yes stop_codon:yes gene_type:complete